VFRRKKYLVKVGLQLRYMMLVLLAMLAVLVVVGWTVYFTIWKEITADPNLTMDKLVLIFEKGNAELLKKLAIIVLFVGVLSIFVSHRIAGPVYRFEKSAKVIAEGDLSLRIRLRKGDELQELADAFNQMTESLESMVFNDRRVLKRLEVVLKTLKEKLTTKKAWSEEDKKHLLNEIENALEALDKVSSSFKLSEEKEKLLAVYEEEAK